MLGYGCPCIVSLISMAIFYDEFGVTKHVYVCLILYYIYTYIFNKTFSSDY